MPTDTTSHDVRAMLARITEALRPLEPLFAFLEQLQLTFRDGAAEG